MRHASQRSLRSSSGSQQRQGPPYRGPATHAPGTKNVLGPGGKNHGEKLLFVAKLEDVPPCTSDPLLMARLLRMFSLFCKSASTAMVTTIDQGCRQRLDLASSRQARLSKFTLTECRSEKLSSMVKLTADLRVTTSKKWTWSRTVSCQSNSCRCRSPGCQFTSHW